MKEIKVKCWIAKDIDGNTELFFDKPKLYKNLYISDRGAVMNYLEYKKGFKGLKLRPGELKRVELIIREII